MLNVCPPEVQFGFRQAPLTNRIVAGLDAPEMDAVTRPRVEIGDRDLAGVAGADLAPQR